jgi:DNA-binding NtrC family response regulator
MEKNNKMFTIGYLDEEEQWKLMFRNSLKSDFNIVLLDLPEKVSDIWQIVEKEKLDALIVDFRLFESGKVTYNGNDVVKDIRSHNLHLPMFVITSYEDNAIELCEDVFIVRGKDMLTDTQKISLFKKMLSRAINTYNHQIIEANETVLEINRKLEKGMSLSAEEEEKRFRAERFLAELNIPDSFDSNMLTSAYSSQLQSLIDAANKIVDSINSK